jgi:hypothetical protein
MSLAGPHAVVTSERVGLSLTLNRQRDVLCARLDRVDSGVKRPNATSTFDVWLARVRVRGHARFV